MIKGREIEYENDLNDLEMAISATANLWGTVFLNSVSTLEQATDNK